jgi:hypothetical protein
MYEMTFSRPSAETWRGVVRVTILVALAAVLMFGDDSWRVVAYSVGVVILLAAVSLLTRRIAFNQLDLQALARTASDTPLGAAIVFAAIVWFCGVLIEAGVTLLR